MWKKNGFKTVVFLLRLSILVIVLAWFLWSQRHVMHRQRHVIKVDHRCTSEVWFHGIGRDSYNWVWKGLSKAEGKNILSSCVTSDFDYWLTEIQHLRQACASFIYKHCYIIPFWNQVFLVIPCHADYLYTLHFQVLSSFKWPASFQV